MAKPVPLRVVDCAQYVDDETVSVLQALLSKALKGEVRGLVATYQLFGGREKSLWCGTYADHPDRALGAAARLLHRALDAESD